MNMQTEIERLQYALAAVSIDHGHGKNPCKLDVPFMERSLVLLRAYRDIQPEGTDMDAILRSVVETKFGNLAETDPIISAIRGDIIEARAAA